MTSLLLDAAAKSVPILCLAAVACIALRRGPAAARYLIWVSSLGMVLLLPVLLSGLPSVRVLPGWLAAIVPVDDGSVRVSRAPVPTVHRTVQPVVARGGTERLEVVRVQPPVSVVPPVLPPNAVTDRTRPTEAVERVPVSLGTLLPLVWGCGTGLMLWPLALGTLAGRRWSRRHPALREGALLDATAAVAAELGIKLPAVHLGPAGAMPMVWGMFRGHLLLPLEAATCDRFPLRTVLLHELAHLRRRDPLTMGIGQWARAVYWFNPLAWLAVSRMRIERERACDDEVLGRGVKASEYAANLLDVAAGLRPALAASLAMADAARIEGRIRRVLDSRQNRRPLTKRSAAVTWILAAVATVSLSMLHAADDARKPAPPSGAEAVKPSVADVSDKVTGNEARQPTPVSQVELIDVERLAQADSVLQRLGEVPPERTEALLKRLGEVSRTKFGDLKPDELAGLLVDDNFQPLAGVLVDLWTFQEGTETTTDADGLFRLKSGEAGTPTVEVRFSKSGYSPHYRPQQPSGEIVLVMLDNKTYLEGTVRDSAGKPVAQALVKGVQEEQDAGNFVVPGPTTTTTTDAEGRYRLYAFPGIYDVRVTASGAGVARATEVEVQPFVATKLDVELRPAVRFEARVIDAETKKPVEKFVLWSCLDTSVRGISDAEGRIVIDGMLPGEFDFFVGHGEPEACGGTPCYGHGQLGRWWSADAVHETQHRKIGDKKWQRNFDNLAFRLSVGMPPVTIETEQGVTFSGRVFDPDGNPVAGATVAPALKGWSLTGDTRYSTTTKADGSYQVVMPAGNGRDYNLMAHDGGYREWRKWANGVSDPVSTRPGQRIENFDLKLTQPATVRGRLLVDENRSVGDREVTGEAADKRESNYYGPTATVRADGTFELKFLRPGAQIIHLGAMRPSPSSVEVTLKEGEVLEGVELRADLDPRAIPPQLMKRSFRVTVLNADGQPVAKQRLFVSREHRMSLNLWELGGTREGLATRMKPYQDHPDPLRMTDAHGHLDMPGGSILFGEYETSAMVVAVDGENARGALGFLYADLKSPQITLHMAPLREVEVAIATDALPASDELSEVEVFAQSRLVMSRKEVGKQFLVQLPVGEYELRVAHPLANPQTVKFTVPPGNAQSGDPAMTLEPVRLQPSHLAKLIGQPAPELRGIDEWKFGEPIRLEEQRGKIIVLAFWHRSYHGGLNSLPTLNTLRERYPAKDVVIVGVFNSFWLKQEPWKRLWGCDDLPFPVALADSVSTKLDGAERDIQGRAMADYGITRFPTTLLIDQTGRVVSLLKSDDTADISRRIDKLLGR